jgi:nitrous oxide reductase accessory protein NosL
MVIENHPGPSGQTFYEGDHPEDRDGPAWFCSSVCTYRYHFAARNRGWRRVVTYLTDYSRVDYSVGEGNRRFVSAHLAAEDFSATEDLQLVVNSDVEGAMGPALVPFSDSADAEAFAEEYGGEVIDTEDVTPELLEQL